MNLTGNTIFITGGGSGIGRGLAEALHARGNKVIISGRRQSVLAETLAANPGIESIELGVQSPQSIEKVAKELVERFPGLNVLINNAGIMAPDGVQGEVDDTLVSSIVNTNLLGPIRMTSALIEHLKKQAEATVINVTSGLAFSPMASTATYCATKAAIHSYSLSLRYVLKDTSVRVLELAPPYVQTELLGSHQATDPRAMPLNEFIQESVGLLETDADEILVERVKPMRNSAGPNERLFFTQRNDMLSANPH